MISFSLFLLNILLLMTLSTTSLAAVKFTFEKLTQQNDVIWGFDFLNDGRIIFTERKGTLKIYDPRNKSVTEIKGAPQVWNKGQGGLLDIRVQPKSQNIFFTYSEPVGRGATTALASAVLSENELKSFKKLFSAHEPSSNNIHFGSRIEFDGKGHVFITVGDRDERSHVQDLAFHTGKIIRLNEDGSIPKDNPFVNNKTAKPEIWSLGHRNAQGLVLDSVTGNLWEAEMGPRGGDEINLIKPGANYGWPIVTYGREYSGLRIGNVSKEGMEPPISYWVPSISPSAMTIYNGEAFPEWKGNIFLGNLSGTHLRRIILNGNKVTHQEELLKDEGYRIRNVRPGPDGFLYLSTDNGLIARLVPAN
ncbi:MAG: PQQ-dependent sugar dehydrogenase [Pseudomonadota bacterium]|nr:PQQ-dependent sugar dehydrogenase [Pseudomonadota bacterium]